MIEFPRDDGPLVGQLHALAVLVDNDEDSRHLLRQFRSMQAVQRAAILRVQGWKVGIEFVQGIACVVFESSADDPAVVLTPLEWSEGMTLSEAVSYCQRHPAQEAWEGPCNFLPSDCGEWHQRWTLYWDHLAERTLAAHHEDLATTEWWAPAQYMTGHTQGLFGMGVVDDETIEGVIVLRRDCLKFLPDPQTQWFDQELGLPLWALDRSTVCLVHHSVSDHGSRPWSHGFDVHTYAREVYTLQIPPGYLLDGIAKTTCFRQLVEGPEQSYGRNRGH